MGLESLVAMAALAGKLGGGDKNPASSERTLNFKPIEGLKTGDSVVYEGGLSCSFPKKGDAATVCRVLDPPVVKVEPGSPIRILDFTLLAEDSDGDTLEYGFDSRYFKRKE
jgi:hypothetical protein